MVINVAVAGALQFLRGLSQNEIAPFVGLQTIGLLLVLFFPQLALWLPNVVFKLR